MLIDDIIQNTPNVGGYGLISAKKFSFKRAFVETCAEFVEEKTFLETMRQMSRLPFGSEAHVFELQTPSFATARNSAVVTFICKEELVHGENYLRFLYFVGEHLFPYAISFCPDYLERTLADEISVTFRAYRATGDIITPGNLKQEDERRIIAGIITLSSLLAVLNSPKIIEKQEVNNDAWNLKRQKHKQKILHNHTVVSIKREIQEAVQKQNEGLQEEHDAKGKRIHWRRGHFKHRATGTFWWSAALIGSGTEVINKRYAVNT